MSVPASPQAWQDQINRSLGLSVLADGASADDPVTPVIWDLHSDKYQPDDYSLQALYTLRDRAKPLVTAMAGRQDYTEGVTSYKDSQLYAQMRKIYDDACAEIEQRIGQLGANRGGAISQMNTMAPNDPATGVFNPNDAAFRGDPVRRIGPWGGY